MEKLMEKLTGVQTMTKDLTAELDAKGQVVILGNKDRVHLPHKSGSHKFKFKLTDGTDLNVSFRGLGAELGETCPSSAGDNTGQITDIEIEDKKAEFVDENSGLACTLSYTWFFSCDDPAQHPTFDPIVDNGGNKV